MAFDLELFQTTVFREVVSDAGIFFTADKESIKAQNNAFAIARDIPPHPRKDYICRHVLPIGVKQRLEGFEKAWR